MAELLGQSTVGENYSAGAKQGRFHKIGGILAELGKMSSVSLEMGKGYLHFLWKDIMKHGNVVYSLRSMNCLIYLARMCIYFRVGKILG